MYKNCTIQLCVLTIHKNHRIFILILWRTLAIGIGQDVLFSLKPCNCNKRNNSKNVYQEHKNLFCRNYLQRIGMKSFEIYLPTYGCHTCDLDLYCVVNTSSTSTCPLWTSRHALLTNSTYARASLLHAKRATVD